MAPLMYFKSVRASIYENIEFEKNVFLEKGMTDAFSKTDSERTKGSTVVARYLIIKI